MVDVVLTVLITRVEDDELTRYCSKWVEKKIIPIAERKNHKVIDLNGKKAIKKEVEGRIKALNPDLLLFNGHGDPSTICGYQLEPLIEDGKNSNILADKVVHSLTCDSAKILGENAVRRHNAYAFIGYKSKFIALNDDNHVTRPFEDQIIRPFMESAMKVSECLVDGDSPEGAFNKSQQMYNYWIYYYRTHSDNKDASDVLLYLMMDRDTQVLIQ